MASGLLLRVLEDPVLWYLRLCGLQCPLCTCTGHPKGKKIGTAPRLHRGPGSDHFGTAIGDFLKSAAELAANFGADEGDKDINEFKSVAAEPRIWHRSRTAV